MSLPQAVERSDERVASGKAESILAAAEREFLARGFGVVSMDAIARAAGASKATVYAHFANKEELFGAVVARVSRRRFGGFSVGDLDPHAAEASLTTIARSFLELVLSPEGIAVNRIVVAEVTRFPALGEVFWQVGPAGTRSQVEEFLGRANGVGSLAIQDARVAAEQFLSLVRGEIHLRYLLRLETQPKPAQLRAAVRASVATFLRAFATKTGD
jgi:TetR/AcrR family transcriptional repressor of mexJK operon